MVKSMDRHAHQDACAKKVIARERARQEKRKNDLPPFLMVSGCVLKHLSPAKYILFQNDIQTIKDAFENYSKKDKKGNYSADALNLTNKVNYHFVAKVLIRHIVKYNPGIFDKMIEDKNSVTDIETTSYIIKAYLRYHAKDDVITIVNTFGREGEPDKSNEVDPRVYAEAFRRAQRLDPNIAKNK